MIHPLASRNPLTSTREGPEVVPIAQRPQFDPEPSTVADADLEAFYHALLNAEEGFNASDYLKEFIDAGGERPFRTTGPQMDMLQKVMGRLKEEGQQDSAAYTLAEAAFGRAFSMNFMLQEYMRTAMTPADDDEVFSW